MGKEDVEICHAVRIGREIAKSGSEADPAPVMQSLTPTLDRIRVATVAISSFQGILFQRYEEPVQRADVLTCCVRLMSYTFLTAAPTLTPQIQWMPLANGMIEKNLPHGTIDMISRDGGVGD
jgi:hypothetical protein